VTLKNTGGQSLKWNVAVQPVGTTWLKVDTDHSTVPPGGQQAIKVTADTKGLTAGQKYDAILIFTSNGGDKQVSVKLTVNPPPVANAGANQTVAAGSKVTLDGSGSKDPGGQPLTYEWTQTGGTTVTLDSSTAVKPTFTAPASAGDLTFQLVVSNGQTKSSPATVTITVK
jgi:hypothetical protein